jgi:ATP-dependent helicase HrpA
MLDPEIYESQIDKIRQIDIFNAGKNIVETILSRLRQRKETFELIARYEKLAKKGGSFDADLFEDLYNQIDAILPADFLDHLKLSDLEDCGRYLKSLAIRSERAYHNPGKDLEKREKLKAHQHKFKSFTEKVAEPGPECQEKIDNYKKMLAELRISLFSPEIKTTISVSEKKLAAAWKDLTAGC